MSLRDDDQDVSYRGSASDYVGQLDAEQDEAYLENLTDGDREDEALVNWLSAAPASSYWSDEGAQNGADHQLRCAQALSWDGEWYDVLFHVHDGPPSAFGGAWVEGWPGSGISVDGQVQQRDNLRQVVRDLLGVDV